jgi:hypothetical protein
MMGVNWRRGREVLSILKILICIDKPKKVDYGNIGVVRLRVLIQSGYEKIDVPFYCWGYRWFECGGADGGFARGTRSTGVEDGV